MTQDKNESFITSEEELQMFLSMAKDQNFQISQDRVTCEENFFPGFVLVVKVQQNSVRKNKKRTEKNLFCVNLSRMDILVVSLTTL